MLLELLTALKMSLEDPFPEPENEVSWDDYLNKLARVDQKNVLKLCQELEKLNEQIPIALMAVGSVLNKPGRSYGDVDLLLLPVYKYEDFGEHWTEETFAHFVTRQPGIVRERKRRRSPPIEGRWRPRFIYESCRYWDIDFGSGKSVQVFICTSPYHMTLREKLEYESNVERLFAYRLF